MAASIPFSKAELFRQYLLPAKARNSEYLLNVNNTQQKDINLTPVHR